jgi:hypothetical protein
MTTIEQIKDALKAHIAEAEAATPGPWESSDNVLISEYVQGYYFVTCDSQKTSVGQDAANAAFIAHARTMSPAACKCLLLAIEELEGIHERTPLGEYDAWDALESIRQEWHNLTTK